MESEFVALAAAGKEVEWLKNLLLEIPLWSKPIAPISIRCDSAATLAKAYSQMYNGKSRHLGVRHSMIRELITNGLISIEFVKSQQNLADHLTKGLARDLVIKPAEGMGLKMLKSSKNYADSFRGQRLCWGCINEKAAMLLVHSDWHGCVDLRFSSEKIVSLFNILHVPNIKKDMVSNIKKDMVSNEVELQQGSLIKRFRTDRGGEYMDTLYFQSVGIIHETTTLYTPQQNGISERKNRVLKEMVNSMLSYSGLNSDPKLKNFEVERGPLNASLFGYDEHSLVFRIPIWELNDMVDDPKTFDEAIKSQDVAFWKEAINDEMDFIMGNNTWLCWYWMLNWLKNLLLEISLWSKPIAPIFIRCDSAATLAKAYSQMYNGKSRHLGVRHNMIRELITNGEISIEFARSQQNLADHLMKGLARDLVIKSAKGMGLKSN
ncbi:zinc finger, CCHC-type containing protein [Tanacetum coccineum]